MSTACSMSCGMPRFVASRFAVPAGRIASAASEPAAASMQRCTVPSPPQTKISSRPLGESALHLLRRVSALRHLDPQWVGDSLALQLAAQLR